MSFLKYNDLIQHGDTVVLYLGFSRMKQIKVKRNEVYQTQFGAVRHNDLIDSKFGSKIKTSKGWVYVLHPTPELWTYTLPHRTQILYSTDISMVLYQLDLVPGKIVVEAGTGSGSLSHAITRTIAPDGHLYTFDFHEQRAALAKEEFDEHGIGHLVTAGHRDVCSDGFNLECIADAVFLDLPSPWEALPHAKKVLKDCGRICSFSPCIEQVQRACETMKELGFHEINTMECLVREYNIQTTSMSVPDLGFEKFGEDTPGTVPKDSDPNDDLVEPQVGLAQRINSSYKKKLFHRKRKADGSAKPGGSKKLEGNADTKEVNADKIKETMDQNTVDNNDENGEEEIQRESEGNGNEYVPIDKSRKTMYTCKSAAPKLIIPGHTGYLTFATLYPSFK